jgi:hypothetical protein
LVDSLVYLYDFWDDFIGALTKIMSATPILNFKKRNLCVGNQLHVIACAPAMDVDQVKLDKLSSLSAMVSSLSDIQSRLQQLRNVPPLLLKSSLPFSSVSIRKDFQQLKELADTIRSDAVQDALLVAAKSERADRSDLNRDGRREIRKRR